MQPLAFAPRTAVLPGERAAARSTGSRLCSGGFSVLALINVFLMLTSFNLMITLSTKHPKCTLTCDSCKVWAKYLFSFSSPGELDVVL